MIHILDYVDYNSLIIIFPSIESINFNYTRLVNYKSRIFNLSCHHHTMSYQRAVSFQDQSQFIHQIQALVILDSNGNKLHAKYYSKSSNFDSDIKQLAFEKKLWEKTSKNNASSVRM